MDKAARESVRSILDVFFWGAIGGLVVVILFLGFFKLTPFKLVNVHGPSMEPTLTNGDLIVIRTGDEIARNQIAVFELPEEWSDAVADGTDSKLIKRVIALPGDQITFQGSSIEVSGGGQKSTIAEPQILNCALDEGESITVPEGSYFLAGDNRVQSFDSMSAWCRGLNPFIDQDTIAMAGSLELRLAWPRL